MIIAYEDKTDGTFHVATEIPPISFWQWAKMLFRPIRTIDITIDAESMEGIIGAFEIYRVSHGLSEEEFDDVDEIGDSYN